MKLKKYLICFVLGFVIIISSGCGIESSTSNTNTLDNTITYVDAITVESTYSRSDIAEAYLEAVATVIIYDSATNSGIGSGSGVAIYSGGYIATNYHVISYVEAYPEDYYIKIQILQDGELTTYNADLLWSNQAVDLAVIRSEYHNIPYVTMEDRWINSDNQLRIAEDVWTLGTPSDISLFGTYSQGYVSSNMYRLSSSDGNIYENLIQHTAPISNGSSGSGLFDAEGNLLALNTLGISTVVISQETLEVIKSNNDLYFSTPIYPIIYIIEDIASLEEDGDSETNYTFPKLGINAYDQNTVTSFTEDGFYVNYVSINGPSAGKLFAGDIITGISAVDANQSSETGYFEINTRNDFIYAMSNFNSGDSIKVYAKHGELNVTVTVVLE